MAFSCISHEVLSECDASSHRFWENSNCRVTSAESAFQSRIGQNSWQGSSYASESGAKTRTHSQSYRETREALPRISHEVLLECDASSHRFRENSNCRVASAESAFQSRIGPNSWRGSSHASESGAKTRAHSQSYRETKRTFL